MRKGFYLVFEGIVGCGKTTQSKILFEKLKQEFPKKEIVWTKEPGGTEIAQEIRKVVQVTPFDEEMEPICEQYLYAASRAQTLRKIVAPVLKRGGIMISDRSFFTSMAYQGFGRGLGLDLVLKINESAIDNLWPDMVLFIDTKIDTALRRAKDQAGDKFESFKKPFFIKVRNGYLEVAEKYKKIVRVVDGDGSVDEVSERVYKIISEELCCNYFNCPHDAGDG
jgi:dTMP kinase